MSKTEYLIRQCDTSLRLVTSLLVRSPVRDVRLVEWCTLLEDETDVKENIDITDYFAGVNET